MFYRIRNHIFNLNEVTNIRFDNGEYLIVDMNNHNRYVIPTTNIDVSALMDKIQKDLTMKG